MTVCMSSLALPDARARSLNGCADASCIVSATAVAFAGEHGAGYMDAPVDAHFNRPYTVCVNPANDSILVVELFGDCVRRIANGRVHPLCGGGWSGFADGIGTNALFNGPCSIACATDGSFAIIS